MYGHVFTCLDAVLGGGLGSLQFLARTTFQADRAMALRVSVERLQTDQARHRILRCLARTAVRGAARLTPSAAQAQPGLQAAWAP